MDHWIVYRYAELEKKAKHAYDATLHSVSLRLSIFTAVMFL